jgi:hypothetical protein
MLEGLKAYTESYVSGATDPNMVTAAGTEVVNTLPKFNGQNSLAGSNITDDGVTVTVNSNEVVNGNITISGTTTDSGDRAGFLKFKDLGATKVLTLDAPGLNTSDFHLNLPALDDGVTVTGTILADFSTIDGGDYL